MAKQKAAQYGKQYKGKKSECPALIKFEQDWNNTRQHEAVPSGYKHVYWAFPIGIVGI